MIDGRKVYDCFTFSTELDILEIRLELLDPVVDHVVLVEAPRTHSGLPKPLHFQENRERFARYAHKITHVVVDDLPGPDPDRWVPERFQRECISRGLEDSAPDDLVLVCDVDEIPDPEIVAQLGATSFDVAALELRMCFYRANWELREPWPLARIALAKHVQSAQELRESQPLLVVKNAGAHLSYLMDVQAITRKYRSFAHHELDNEKAASPRFLELMHRERIFAPTLEQLRVRVPEGFGAVQHWLHTRRPDLFEFDVPPSLERHAAVAWGRLRSRSKVPKSIALRGDQIALAMTGLSRTREGTQ